MKWFNSAFSISNKHRHNRLHLLSEFSRREKKQGVLHLNDIPAGTRSSDCNQNSLRRKTSGTVKPKPLESWISERWSSDESPVCDKSDRSGTGFIWEAEKTLSLWWLKTTQQFEVWLYYNSAAKGLAAISAALCRIKEPLTVAATLDGLPSFIMIKKMNRTDSINFCGPLQTVFKDTSYLLLQKFSNPPACVCVFAGLLRSLISLTRQSQAHFAIFTISNGRRRILISLLGSKIDGCHVFPNKSMHAGKDIPCRSKHTQTLHRSIIAAGPYQLGGLLNCLGNHRSHTTSKPFAGNYL